MYPAVRTEMAELKSFPTRPRSSSKVLRRACLDRQNNQYRPTKEREYAQHARNVVAIQIIVEIQDLAGN
jgi:hypothetical protein